MKLREYSRQRSWKLMGPVLPGGTIYSLVLSPNEEQHNPLLAGTAVGIFRSLSRGDKWTWANRGLAGLQISALAVTSNGVLFSGTLDGILARSVDGGYSWACMPPLEDSGSITAIAASPDYVNDGAILIGTEQGGIFRSTDSGRTAKPANFGLGELTVLSLACASGWPEKPVAFAGTIDGLYQSTNGGRAWRRVRGDLEGLAVQAVATSPEFHKDGTIFVATEEDGIFRSTEGGRHWEQVGQDIPDATVNSLWISDNYARDRTVLAGTSAAGLFRSQDGGDTWEQVLDTGNAVLALAGDEASVFAGFHSEGIYRSVDGGRSWQPCQEGLHANAFTDIACTSGNTLFAAGPDTGVYTSTDGSTWQPLETLPEVAGVAALAAAPNYEADPTLLVADIESGLWLSNDGGKSWHECMSAQASAICASLDSEQALRLWAGTSEGAILRSCDQGKTWETLHSFGGQAVLRLQASPAFMQDQILVAGTRDLSDPSAPIIVWRSSDGGHTWAKLLEEEVTLQHIAFAIDAAHGGLLRVALGRHLISETNKGEWKRHVMSPDEPPVLAVALRQSERDSFAIVGTSLGVFVTDGTSSAPMMRGMGYAPIIGLSPATGDTQEPIWAMGLGGLIWKWDLAQPEENTN